MRKLLFVTNRNILTTCGELRLIKNRAEELYSRYGIITDFIALSSKARINSEKKETINAGGKIDVFEFSVSNPIVSLNSFNRIKVEIKNRLKHNEYDAVILSGIAMPILAKNIRMYSDIRIVLDIHGAQEDILEVAKNGTILKRLIFRVLYSADRMSLKNNFRLVDGCFVVTNSLERYLRERYEIRSETMFFKVPCATSTDIISDTEYKKNREIYRAKYNIGNDELIFIYSGGISSWQCVNETIDLYEKIAAGLDRESRMLIFSHNIDSIRNKIIGDKRIITDSYLPEELSKALCAGDFAFLLRKDCLTNNVAFPNKFLEYVQSGMKIITTPYVYEIRDQVQENELGYIYNFQQDITDLFQYINNTENRYPCINKINEVLLNNSFEKCLESFAKDFLDDEK